MRKISTRAPVPQVPAFDPYGDSMGRSASSRLLPAVLALLIPLVAGRAQIPPPPGGDFGEILHATPHVSHDRVYAGGDFRLALTVDLDFPWHVNSDRPLQDYLIPTDLSLDPPEELRTGEPIFPSARNVTLAFSDEPLSVYDSTFVIGVEAEVAEGTPPGEFEIAGTLTYQACDDSRCLPPRELPVTFTVRVASLEEPTEQQAPEVFARVDWPGDAGAGEGRVGRLLAERGLLVSLLFIYLGGLALNLTPCVYPLIPITISYFGGQAGGRPRKSFGLALIYILGMAITYSVLGVIAAMTGGLLGSALQNPIVLIFVAGVITALALSMFGLYEIQVPQGLTRFAGGSRQGVMGALFMGLTMGIVAAPCIGPFVLSLLLFVGESGNPLTGFIFFFVLAVGLGTPFLFLGTLSGSLPKPGAWMVWIRKIFGVVLLGMAVYFLETLLPGGLYRWLLAGLALAGGLYLGVLEGTRRAGRGFLFVRGLTGIAFAGAGIWILMSSSFLFGSAEESPVSWRHYDEALLENAVSENMPVIIDFYADWCIPCKELDKATFSHPEFVNLSEKLVPVKADLTHSGNSRVKAIKEKYEVVGVPTVVFLDRDGSEREELRFTGFVPAETFLRKVRSLLGAERAEAGRISHEAGELR
jgi:thiol:disulfide interchange protein DsbD